MQHIERTNSGDSIVSTLRILPPRHLRVWRVGVRITREVTLSWKDQFVPLLMLLFAGHLPKELRGLNQLQRLWLNSNQFTGEEQANRAGMVLGHILAKGVVSFVCKNLVYLN